MKIIEKLLKNWKTTSAGLTLIIGSIVHLIFVHRTATEETWTTALLAVVGGLGLMFARDNAASEKSKTELEAKIEAVKGDTTTITKP